MCYSVKISNLLRERDSCCCCRKWGVLAARMPQWGENVMALDLGLGRYRVRELHNIKGLRGDTLDSVLGMGCAMVQGMNSKQIKENGMEKKLVPVYLNDRLTLMGYVSSRCTSIGASKIVGGDACQFTRINGKPAWVVQQYRSKTGATKQGGRP